MLKNMQTVFASAARTATPTAVALDTAHINHLVLVIDCTVDPAAASVVFDVDFRDPISGKYITMLASSAIAAVGTTVLQVGPGLVAAANSISAHPLSSDVRITATHADADSITYSVSAFLYG